MNNVVYLEEFKIKRAIDVATSVLEQALDLQARGTSVSDNIIYRLEIILETLEEKLHEFYIQTNYNN
tara:strand:- start:276 stop:476 length:201 start_codon:yes stop_codon:yes gene_type:complete